MEATPDLRVYDLGHLGLVASTVDRVGAGPPWWTNGWAPARVKR